MNNQVVKFSKWMEDAKALSKAAADAAAFEMKDPTDKGTPDIPKHPEGDNRSALQLPTNQKNSNEGCIKDEHIMNVTKPDGVGQGEYITPENGDAKDQAFTSPTTPLSKIAAKLDAALGKMQVQEAPAAAAAPEKSAASQQEVSLPTQLASEPGLLEKLAGIGAVMAGTEEGRQAVAEVLEKVAGAAEARSLIASVQEDMQKEAAAQAAYEQAIYEQAAAQQVQMSPELEKIAAAHQAELDKFEYDFEKLAYAQGAADAESVDEGLQSAEEGAEPSIPGADDLSDEDILGILQELVASGEVSEEEVAQLIEQLQADGQPGGSLEEIAAALEAAVQSGEIDPEQAQQIAQAIMQNDPEAQAMAAQGGAEAPVEEAPAAPEAPAEDPTVKTAAVINALFGTK